METIEGARKPKKRNTFNEVLSSLESSVISEHNNLVKNFKKTERLLEHYRELMMNTYKECNVKQNNY